MITFAREQQYNYTMEGACGVIYQGEIHFLGGDTYSLQNRNAEWKHYDFNRQHFVIETRRSGRMPKMTRKEDLDIGLANHACSTLKITTESFLSPSKEIVILCFGSNTMPSKYPERSYEEMSSCFLFDGKVTYIGKTNFPHSGGKLTTYKKNIIAIGGTYQSHKTEIMERKRNGTLST